MSVSDLARRPIARLKGGERAITILGATGSIGASTIDLLRRGRDGYRVEALTAGRNVKALAKLALEFNARVAVIADATLYGELKELLVGSTVEAAAGEDAVVEAAERPVDWLMAAITGASGLKPTLAAIERGNTVALANKECLVCAGALFMRRAAAVGATVLPVDSEHNAVFQALASGNRGEVKRVILTASGGPFRTWTLEQIKAATVQQALKHPNWSMGAKVTIDSATLMNKGLEMIEAQHLFALEPQEIDVIVHPQSVVHSLVEYCDGSFVAQLGSPDMRIPIAHCLAWPERLDWEAPRLDLAKVAALTFEEPDIQRFPALGLAKYALTRGGAAATVLNAADEVAVAEFIAGNLGFTGIAQLVESTMAGVEKRGLMAEPAAIEAALAVDHIARSLARELLPQIAAKAS